MSKRRVNKGIFISRLLLCFLVLALIIFGFVYAKTYIFKDNQNTALSSNRNEPNVDQQVQEPKEETTSASFVCVGDYLIHSSVYDDAHKNANNKGYDFKPMLTYVKDIVKDYDVGYYNQETILGGTELGLSNYPAFNSPQEAGDAMLDAGFNLVSLSTNHTLDSGSKAVLNSRAYWDKQDDVLAVGSYDSFEARDEVVVKEINGITYAMLNYTYGTNGIPVPEGKEYLVNVWPTDLNINDPDKDTKYQEYKKQVEEDIEKVRDKVDVLLVAMHWGVEYTHTPTEYQVDAAEFLADHDVDVIIGTHPHVIQPVTWIDDTLVIYSLGNFLSAQYQDENYNKSVGLMTSFTVTKTSKGDDVKISVDDVQNQLLYAYYNQSTWGNFKVVPFSHPDIAKYMSNYKSVYNTYKKIVQKMDEDMYVVPLSK